VDQPTLPDIVPTAELSLRVLLGPGSELVVIGITVRDPAGRLLAERSFPGDVYKSPVAQLDRAWRALLAALPREFYSANRPRKAPRFPGKAERQAANTTEDQPR
jgi:hypothetical protein